MLRKTLEALKEFKSLIGNCVSGRSPLSDAEEPPENFDEMVMISREQRLELKMTGRDPVMVVTHDYRDPVVQPKLKTTPDFVIDLDQPYELCAAVPSYVTGLASFEERPFCSFTSLAGRERMMISCPVDAFRGIIDDYNAGHFAGLRQPLTIPLRPLAPAAA